MAFFEIHFDGSCGPKNPGGKMGWGFIITKIGPGANVDRITGKGETEPHPTNTNNVAEYTALFEAMKTILDQHGNDHDVVVRGDSMLVIRQMSGDWRIRSGNYESVARECITVAQKFGRIRFEWIPREKNQHADTLSRT